jgi:hypothetical protein
MSQNVFVKSGRVTDILPSVGTTSTTTGNWFYKDAPKAAIQVVVVGTGAVAATVVIEVSNDATYAIATALGTITVSGTTSASDGFTTDAPWKYIRARVTAVSGTGATINVYMSV